MIAPSGLALLLEQSASPAGSASLRALRTAWRAEPGLRGAWGDAAPQAPGPRGRRAVHSPPLGKQFRTRLARRQYFVRCDDENLIVIIFIFSPLEFTLRASFVTVAREDPSLFSGHMFKSR